MTKGSKGRTISEPIVGVVISGVRAILGRGKGKGRTFTTSRGMSRLKSQSFRPQVRVRVFAMTRQ